MSSSSSPSSFYLNIFITTECYSIFHFTIWHRTFTCIFIWKLNMYQLFSCNFGFFFYQKISSTSSFCKCRGHHFPERKLLFFLAKSYRKVQSCMLSSKSVDNICYCQYNISCLLSPSHCIIWFQSSLFYSIESIFVWKHVSNSCGFFIP